MNQNLKNILHTAWTEPRHFFFWSALLGLCGFVGVAACTGLSGSNLILAMAALICGLCFVLGVAAFILAWIPPVRRLFTWLLAQRFIALVCLITLVALFYAFENWRGRKAWQSFERQRESQGDHFKLRQRELFHRRERIASCKENRLSLC